MEIIFLCLPLLILLFGFLYIQYYDVKTEIEETRKEIKRSLKDGNIKH